MRILLIHQGFPGQFKHLVPTLLKRGHKLHAISKPRQPKKIPDGIVYRSYRIERGNTPDIHPLCLELESKVIRGEAVAIQAEQMKKEGFRPDLILGHPGWGEMLFLGDIWPTIPQLHYVEFFHGFPGTDNDFDGGIGAPLTWRDRAKARIKNAHHLSSLNAMTAGITPTKFQHSVLPPWAQRCTHVIHDGIDCEWLKPAPTASLQIPAHRDCPQGLNVRAGDPVLTFINRTFEPYRGIHIFLEALSEVQRNNPQVQTILVGQDTPQVSYGAHREDGQGWLSALRKQMGSQLDWSRIHCLGLISHHSLRQVYQVSAAHVYLSYPFVLSWSLLEAMSCGCLIIGSETAPLQEVINDGVNGLLTPFSDPRALGKLLLLVLEEKDQTRSLRKQARSTVTNTYELRQCLHAQLELIENLG